SGSLAHSLASAFFFHDPPSTELYTLSLHDALPISANHLVLLRPYRAPTPPTLAGGGIARKMNLVHLCKMLSGRAQSARRKDNVSPSTPRSHKSWAAAAISSTPSTIVAKTLPGTQPASPLISRLLRP